MIYNETKLNDENFLQQIKSQAEEMILYDQVHEASVLKTSLEQSLNQFKGFKDRNYDLYVQYEKIIVWLKWLILPLMDIDKVAELFKSSFIETYKMPDYNLWQKIRGCLIGFLVFDNKDNFKKDLRQALLENKEQLTSKKIATNNQPKEPTVGNWISDYNSNLGTEVVDNIKRIQYFTNNNNIKILDEKERVRVKILLDLYERLKLSSHTLEGLEEDIPVDDEDNPGIIRNGIFEPYKEEKIVYQSARKNSVPPAKSRLDNDLTELKALAASYSPGSLERKAVEEEIGKVRSKK